MDKEPPIEPTALLCSTIRKLYTHDEIKNGIEFDERIQKIKDMSSGRPLCLLELYISLFLELIKETYFKELPVEFNVFWQRQAKKTLSGQKRALCGRDKQKAYVFI